MSLGEELSRVDTDKAVDLLVDLFGPGDNSRTLEFWENENGLADEQFPVFKAMEDKTHELEDYYFNIGMSEEKIKGLRMGINILKFVFSAYTATEMPDAPPEEQE
jgi:hypothetical protein